MSSSMEEGGAAAADMEQEQDVEGLQGKKRSLGDMVAGGQQQQQQQDEEDDERTIALGRRLLEACKAGQGEEVNRLLKDGAPAYFQAPETGLSCLMAAAGEGHAEVVGRLLEAGAPWNALDRQGRCAGEYAMEGGEQAIIDRLVDHAVMAEMILGVAEEGAALDEEGDRYLKGRVRYDEGGERLVDEEDDGVMMAWEAPLMQAHAQLLCGEDGDRDVLNLGFGMGIIDGVISSLGCRSHTIIEAHPDVLAKARADGWEQRATLLPGRWQDVVPALIKDGRRFDAVFFDTYAEHYKHMQEWHKMLPSLLRPGGVYSFFNGLAPDNPFFHAVACQMVKLELEGLGFHVEFLTCKVEGGASDEETWAGLRRRYWHGREEYYLPHAIMVGAQEEHEEEGEEGPGLSEAATADDTLVGVATLADGVTQKEVLLRPCLDSAHGGLQWLAVADADRTSPLALGQLRTWFPPMLLDGPRNAFFHGLVTTAMARARASGEGVVRVLDIGTGTGLLSLWAAQADEGAEVVGVEANPAVEAVARQVVGRAAPELAKRVTIVGGRSQEVEVGDLGGGAAFDVVVAELLDSTLLAEGFMPALRDAKARGLVRPGAVVAPRWARVWGRLVECAAVADLHQLQQGHGDGEEMGLPVDPQDVAACARSGHGRLLPLHVGAMAPRYLSEPFLLLQLDFDALTDPHAPPPPHRGPVARVAVTSPGTMHGVVVCWDIRPDEEEEEGEGGCYSTAPWPVSGEEGEDDVGARWQDHWRPCVWPVSPRPLACPGAMVPVRAAHDDSTVWLAVGEEGEEGVEVPDEPRPCLCGLHPLLGQPETGLPVDRMAALNHQPSSQALRTAIGQALAAMGNGGGGEEGEGEPVLVLDVSDGGRAGLMAASLALAMGLEGVQVVSLQSHSLHHAMLSQAVAARGLEGRLHVWKGVGGGEAWQWGEGRVKLVVGDGFYQRIGVNRPVWSVMNLWFLRTALAPVLARDAAVLPFRARVMAALVEFDHLGRAHGLPVPDVGGFDHSPLREGLSLAAQWSGSDEDKDLPIMAQEHRHRLLSPPALLLSLDLHREVSFRQAESLQGVYRTGHVEAPVTAEGEAQAVLVWVDLDLTYEAAVTGGPEGVLPGYCGSEGEGEGSRGWGWGMRQSVRWLPERRRVRPGEDWLSASASVNVINPEVRADFNVGPRGQGGDDEDDRTEEE